MPVEVRPYTIEDIATENLISPSQLLRILPSLGIHAPLRLTLEERFRVEGFLDTKELWTPRPGEKPIVIPKITKEVLLAKLNAIPNRAKPQITALAAVLGLRPSTLCHLVPIYGGKVQLSSFPISVFTQGRVLLDLNGTCQLTRDCIKGTEIVRLIMGSNNPIICRGPLSRRLLEDAIGLYCEHRRRYAMSPEVIVLALKDFLCVAPAINIWRSALLRITSIPRLSRFRDWDYH
jgi:hypothetical protein